MNRSPRFGQIWSGFQVRISRVWPGSLVFGPAKSWIFSIWPGGQAKPKRSRIWPAGLKKISRRLSAQRYSPCHSNNIHRLMDLKTTPNRQIAEIIVSLLFVLTPVGSGTVWRLFRRIGCTLRGGFRGVRVSGPVGSVPLRKLRSTDPTGPETLTPRNPPLRAGQISSRSGQTVPEPTSARPNSKDPINPLRNTKSSSYYRQFQKSAFVFHSRQRSSC